MTDQPAYPAYPDLGAGVAKHRAIASRRGGLSAMTWEERYAYGEAVERAIRAKQRAELLGTRAPLPTAIGYGDALLARQRAALQAAVARERRERTPDQWQAMYEAAMAEKSRLATLAGPPAIELPATAQETARTAPVSAPGPIQAALARPRKPKPKFKLITILGRRGPQEMRVPI